MKHVDKKLVLSIKISYIRNMKLIELNLDKIVALCKKYKVNKLWVFGSILTDRFNDNSDLDFSVKFDKDKLNLTDYADNYLDFHEDLKLLFSRNIDLVTEDSLTNPYFIKELNTTKQLIYG